MTISDGIRSAWKRAFDEGPVRHDGRWLPDGGLESYVHSHQFEPLPVFDPEQAKTDQSEDKELFRVMKKLSGLTTDDDVAAYALQHFPTVAARADSARAEWIEVISSTSVRRHDEHGNVTVVTLAS
jgi:hypothetical protein